MGVENVYKAKREAIFFHPKVNNKQLVVTIRWGVRATLLLEVLFLTAAWSAGAGSNFISPVGTHNCSKVVI